METARATHWTCAAASAVAADRMSMLLVILIQKYTYRYAKIVMTACVTRVTCMPTLKKQFAKIYVTDPLLLQIYQ